MDSIFNFFLILAQEKWIEYNLPTKFKENKKLAILFKDTRIQII